MTGTGGIGKARVPRTLTDVIVDLQFDLGIKTRLVGGDTRAVHDVWERGNPNVATFDRREDAAACLYSRQTDRVAAHLLSDARMRVAVRAGCEADGSADPCAFPDCSCLGKPTIVAAALQAAIGAASEGDVE